MTLKTKIIGTAAAAAMAGTIGLLPATAAEAAPPAVAGQGQVAQIAQPVTGTLADGTAFTGAISNLTTSVVDGALQLTGTLTGTGLPAAGQSFTTTVPLDSLIPSNACTILTLDLQPLHLDLLGLVVDLAPVHLDITAQPGPGNLLGNLLCAVTGLLDNGGPLQGISALLNRLLTGLGL